MTAAELWEGLRSEALVEGERPEARPPVSPWYVRAMLGVAGWIGALFLLGFLGSALAFLFDDSGFALAIGVGCCAGAFALFRFFAAKDFAEQFALAVSLVGQVLLIVGFNAFLEAGSPSFYLAIAAAEAGLALAVPISCTGCWRPAARRSRSPWRSTRWRCTAWPRRCCAPRWPGSGSIRSCGRLGAPCGARSATAWSWRSS
jgi:hypothetical protein